MTQRVTRQVFERRYEARAQDQALRSIYEAKIREERIDKVHQETDERANNHRKAARQRIADQEFEMAEKLYKQQREKEERERALQEQDAIAQALAEQQQDELRDKKMRGVLRENDSEIKELQSKLQLALVTQTRDQQRKEAAIRKAELQKERIEEENEMIRNFRKDEELRAMEESAKHQESLATRAFIQEQLRDKERRRQLLEVADRKRDEEQVKQIVEKIMKEDQEKEYAYREKQKRNYEEMQSFLVQRKAMKESERRAEEDEDMKMREFAANVDDRLRRAQDAQKLRDQQRSVIAEKIAKDIRAKKSEQEEYEQLCLDLAEQQELQRLQDRERAEAEKIRKQIEECRFFMEATIRAKKVEKERSKQEELRIKQQIVEQQKRLAELAEIEQEQNRIKIEKFRRELARQMIQKREMYESARQQELRKLQIEQQREAERQRVLNDERRKLVVNHIIAMGPDAVKYLPKGVLKEEDLDYLPEEFRRAILNAESMKH